MSSHFSPTRPVQPLQAVFWDMDGTLVDTEPYWIAAEHELVESFGGSWTTQQAHALVGQALTHSAAVLQSAGVDLEIRQIIDHLISQVVVKVREQMPWRPGARELLEDLQAAGVRCALVTMSERPLADEVVAALPEGQIEFVISGDMVTRGKPDPEAYEMAFAQMAANHPEPLDRGRCLAVEDSVPGTAAAADSGIVTLAVPHMSPLEESRRWHVLPSLRGLDAAALAQLVSVTPGTSIGSLVGR